MHRYLVVAAATLLFAAAACSSAGETSPQAGWSKSPTPTVSVFAGGQEIQITRRTSRGPETCYPENVGRLVAGFFAAVNRGDVKEAMGAFTDKLGWYSVTEGNPRGRGRHFVAYKPSELRSYLSDRVTQNERMYLVSIDVDYERPGNLGHVAYRIHRTADDLTDYSPKMGGKGAIDCSTGLISVWSMAQGHEPVPGSLCPGEPETPTAALACARR